ncbi:lipoate--protein ligase [Candidatus Izemoplasma sp. B36]|uniref:lipoate--protein ligase n=1 Tax=Candidatus Izemoplasma sp. B36 TaxID=3242468 RepID=UPI003556DC58
MIYINYPNEKTERLTFYLATEEYLARKYPEEDYFFMWQVNPTVIFGRNQLIENEVNLDYVKRNKIEFYRRKSGGGCVYSDPSNIMFSFITPNINKTFVFDTYLDKIVELLKELGLNAYFSGRNDILIDGMKVSGNAFYRVNNRSVVHGTMLYNTDLSVMVKAITPDNEKLISKGIESVRSRVTNIKNHIDISIEDFKNHFKSNICDDSIVLTEKDILGIREIESKYLEKDFIYGKNPNYSVRKKGKTEAGILEISIELKNNIVKNINMLGDFFLVKDEDDFLNLFKGLSFEKDAFSSILDKINIEDYIYNLKKEDFINILFN